MRYVSQVADCNSEHTITRFLMSYGIHGLHIDIDIDIDIQISNGHNHNKTRMELKINNTHLHTYIRICIHIFKILTMTNRCFTDADEIKVKLNPKLKERIGEKERE